MQGTVQNGVLRLPNVQNTRCNSRGLGAFATKEIPHLCCHFLHSDVQVPMSQHVIPDDGDSVLCEPRSVKGPVLRIFRVRDLHCGCNTDVRRRIEHRGGRTWEEKGRPHRTCMGKDESVE